MRSLLSTAALAVVALGTVAATADARAPSVPRAPAEARIVLGSGMAGAKLNQPTGPVVNGALRTRPFASWGLLEGEFCFEGTSCSWTVPGGGDVIVERHGRSRRVLMIGTTSAGWRTSKDVGPGTTLTTLKARYTGLRPMTTCQIGGFGGENAGYRLGKHSFFRTSGGKVTAVYVTRYTITAGC